ncbi:MAG: ribonuclease P protein component [Xanthomonadales bacterium]|nr:ribonuclease P protein component [Xanthomonadales bacterium]
MTANGPSRGERTFLIPAVDPGAVDRSAAAPAAFPRSARLLKPRDFQRVFARPRVCSDAYFKLLTRDNDAGQTRIGMAVSKRVDRHAVGRNRIKRIVRESFRHWRADRRQTALEATGNHTSPGQDIVVLARPPAAMASNEQLFSSLGRLWKRLEDQCERALEPQQRKTDHSGSVGAGTAAKGKTHGKS